MAAFVDRYSAVFGRNQSLLLKLAGMTAAEATASGAWVEDSEGSHWLDAGSFGLHLLGHRHPEVVRAAVDILQNMGLSTKVLANRQAVDCAERLIGLTGEPIDKVIFANTGSEAVETAVRLASSATGRSRFVALAGAYHGKTLAAAALTDSPHRAPVAHEALDVVRVARDDLTRFESLLAAEDVAAVFVEPVQGEGGIRPVSPQVLWRLGELCRASGTLLVVDEIQTGLGRAGRLVNYPPEASPAVVLFGKVLGGGLVPLAAAAFDSELVPRSSADPVLHSSSFAAGPLATAVGRAAIDVVSDRSFVDRVGVLSARISERLRSIAAHSWVVADWRGCGLMFGIEFTSFEACGQVVLEAAKRRLLTTFCLNDPRVMRLYPPAIISDEELEQLLDRLSQAIRAAEDWLGEASIGSDER